MTLAILSLCLLQNEICKIHPTIMLQKHRILTLSIILVFVTAVAMGSWLLGSQIQSPAEAAARTAPPEPSPILVPVTEQLLTSDVVARGTARYGIPKTVALVPSTLKGTVAIITTLPQRGEQLQEGDLLLTASERPVFLLQGEMPVYRDLVIGTTGTDVQQLEAALQRLGYTPGALDGTFDEATADAVTAWYQANGWSPAPPAPSSFLEIARLTAAIHTAQNELATVKDAAALAPLLLEQARANAAYANQVAAALVAKRSVAAVETDGDVVSAQLEAAQAAATATALDGDVAVQQALRAQTAAERAVTIVKNTIEQLTTELAAAEQLVNGYIPADEIVFVPTLPVRIENSQVDIGDLARGPVLMVTNNQLAIDSQLPLGEAALVEPGMAVVIDEPDLGVNATGTVARVAEAPGTDGVDGYHIYFETTVNETTKEINGFSVRLTIPVESTDGAVTVVPVSALSLRANGESTVDVEHNGVLESLVVVPGLAADGMVEVTAVDGALLPGQLVVVGYATEVQE